MKQIQPHALRLALALSATLLLSHTYAQPDSPDFRGPPGFRPGGGPGGPGGMTREKTVLLKQFDKDGDGRLNVLERQSAREYLQKEGAAGKGRRGFGRGGAGRFGGGSSVNEPGQKLTPQDVKSYLENPFYDPTVVRTFFLEFENSDWEMELQDFHDTDIEVPARLTVDGKTYNDVGVHFRGMSSYGMVRPGQKRSLNVSLDLAHKGQNIGGYRTLNLLNSHEDPSFLRSILYYQVAREYIPAPKANFARVVINGESWGVYVNVEQFNKDFTREWFGTSKGARWKVPGSPGARGGLAYLGNDAAAYKKIYEIKSKDDPKPWADFIRLCKVLNETPANQLEAALSPILDIDGALRFIALDNALINGDGYWVRTSDYSIYEDEKGKFHIIPQDANETFSRPGGGPGGAGGGPGGPGGGPGGLLAREMVDQADKDQDGRLTAQEFASLADKWFTTLKGQKAESLDEQQLTKGFSQILPPPPGFGPGREGDRADNFGPARFVGASLFKALDVNGDGIVHRNEFSQTFEKWFREWGGQKSGSIDEEKIRTGLATILPAPGFGPGRAGRPGAMAGGPGGGRRIEGGGPFNMPHVDGVKLDPLVAANDPNKALISKLLAVPAFRARYLTYVREIAEKWLDWRNLGPVAEEYHKLVAQDIKADTRKLDTTADFEKSLTEDIKGSGFGPGGGGTIGLKNFADERRAYLLAYPEIQKLPH